MLVVRRSVRLALTAVACVLIAGCGDDDAPDATRTTAKPAKVDVTAFLLRDGEEPGFRRVGSPRVQTDADSIALSPEGAERMRAAGFVSTTFGPIEADRERAGVTRVDLFETEQGAREWTEYELSDESIQIEIPGAKIERFTVPGVPGAQGWTGRDVHGFPIGNVFWVQGRCLLVIANEDHRGRDFVKRLSAGATAIYERTKGRCPG